MDDNSLKLASLLKDRSGWQTEADDDGQHWLFGVDGAARLVITPEMDGFLMDLADQDRSWVIPRIDQVEAWLDENEADHSGLSPLQEEYKRASVRVSKQDPGI